MSIYVYIMYIYFGKILMCVVQILYKYSQDIVYIYSVYNTYIYIHIYICIYIYMSTYTDLYIYILIFM